MEITIEYNSCWRNSFLDKTNNEKVDKKNNRKYIASSQSLAKPENYIKREVTIDTVMGVLNRLIGEPRKLWQAREDENYFFKNIEPLVTFHDDVKCLSNEIVGLRNQNGNYNPASFSGSYKTSSPIFTSDFSAEMWGVFAMDFEELLNYIVTGVDPLKHQDMHPFSIFNRLDEISKFKSQKYDCQAAFDIIKAKFADEWEKDVVDKALASQYYFAALYLKFDELTKRGFNITSILSKNGKFSGFSKRSFTKSDFNGKVTTGGKQLAIGNPYFIKGMGIETEKMLTKADGTVTINIDIDDEKSLELKTMIENASVASFRLGKKGLAYVSNVRI
jgi:hypothetical protein